MVPSIIVNIWRRITKTKATNSYIVLTKSQGLVIILQITYRLRYTLTPVTTANQWVAGISLQYCYTQKERGHQKCLVAGFSLHTSSKNAGESQVNTVLFRKVEALEAELPVIIQKSENVLNVKEKIP